MSGSVVEVLKTTPRMGRRSMALADIDPKYVSQSGIWEASEVETSKGSIRIQHLTAVATSLRSVSSAGGGTSIVGAPQTNPRFPKLEECAHFHYDYVELPVLKISLREDTSKSVTLPAVDETTDKCAVAIEVAAGGQSWIIRRTHANFILLDEQLHRCVWDRSFSRLERLKESLVPTTSSSSRCIGKRQASSCVDINQTSAAAAAAATARRRTTSTGNNHHGACEDLAKIVGNDEDADHEGNASQQQSDHPDEEHNGCRDTIIQYLSRLAQLPTNKITCGTCLSWLELDNRGRHIVSSDDSDINTPAVAAACAVRKYVAQAADEISFEVGDMISVIDMPPPEESIWWRGKRGFHVGFFPRECVQVIGDKVPAGLPAGLPIVSSVRRLQRLSVSSGPSSSSSVPEKPVLRKHGKLIAFFRSFILSRPSRRRLKQSGILRERVFSCDLAEHLLNTGNDIPAVLKCCAEFIEKRGIVDGIYRLSGITSNIQKLRNLFDEDKTPNLEDDIAIKQDIHAVSSLIKQYFRELPNPLCTYQLYDKFVAAAQASDEERLFRMREVVHELPPPHYRTLEYLMSHLASVAQRSSETGMTPKNMAIVWAPNLIRCKELEAGGVDALKGIGVQAVVTEYLVRHADLIFNDKLPANYPITTTVLSHKASCESGRPKSLAISSPIRLMSLEEAQDRVKQDDRKYIEVGGGPSSLPPKYHTVIDLPSRRSAMKHKRSPIGWRQFFSRNRSFSKPSSRKITNPIEITVVTKSMPCAGPQGMQSNWVGRLRPVKSVESLVSSPMFTGTTSTDHGPSSGNHLDREAVIEEADSSLSKSSPATPVLTDVDVLFHAAPHPIEPSRPIQNPKTHNRSISHDSYFEFGEFRNSNRVYIDETLEEETLSQSSKLSLEVSSGGESPTRKLYAKDTKGKGGEKRGGHILSPITPPPSAASLVVPTTTMTESVTSTSSDDVANSDEYKSPLLPTKWRDSEVQTSQTKLYDVGVSTQEDMEQTAINTVITATSAVSSSTTTTSLASSSQQTSTGCSGVTRDSSEQSLISHSSSADPILYELDRNSSVDDSSVESTPCEPFSTTNIIYSPLVDDLSSPASSGEHFRFGSGVDPFRVPTSDSEMSSVVSSSASNKKGSTLYVCPLYEAGVSTVESISSAASAKTEATDISLSGSVSPRARVNQYENVSVLNTHNSSSNKPNSLQVFLCSSASTKSLDTVATQQAGNHTPMVCHIYENHHLYENHPPPVPAIRKSKSEGAVFALTLSSSQQKDTPPTVNLPQPPALPAVTNVQVEPHSVYENVSEIEVKPEDAEMLSPDHNPHESNIYEDIDDDEDDDDLNIGNKYETVDFENGVAKPKAVESDDEYEKVQESSVVIHHYAEIEERMDTTSLSPVPTEQSQVAATNVVASSTSEEEAAKDTSFGAPNATTLSAIIVKSEESSPSHSHTEDMVTYLEVQTPHLNLRNNSLDEQEEISQQSCGGSRVKLQNTNSLNSSSDTNTPPGDEGEIRHIDSPLNSPVAATASSVNNPLYGLQQNVSEEEAKDADDLQSDGEDMSVNESLSISISMDENNTPNKVKANVSQDTHDMNGALVSGGGLRLVSRCNSAPLAVSVHEFTVALEGSENELHPSLEGRKVGADGSGDGKRFSKSASSKGLPGGRTAKEDEVEKRYGEKVLLCKRLSEPSLLFSVNNNINNNMNYVAAMSTQKTDSEIDRTNNCSSSSSNPAAWKMADAKRLANRKQSVKELLSKFESRDSLSNNSTSPVQSPQNNNYGSSGGGALLPPTGLSKNEMSCSNNNIKENCGSSGSGRSSSNNSINYTTNNSNNGESGGFQHHHHRFSTGDILMTQSASVVEKLSSVPSNSSTNHFPASIVRSDTFPELSRDDSACKENALHGTFSSSERSDDQGGEKSQCALRVAMSSVDMNDPSRRERIEKYKEERRSFLRQKINSELTSQQKPPTELQINGPILSSSVTVTESPDSDLVSANRGLESPRKRAFSDDSPTGGNATTTKSIKTDPFSLKCAFLASTTTTTTSTRLMETSLSAGGCNSSKSEILTSSTTISSTKSLEEATEEINVRERVALWSSSAAPKKEPQPVGRSQSNNIASPATSSTSFTLSTTTSTSQTQSTLSNGNSNSSAVTATVTKGVPLSSSVTEFPNKASTKPLLRRELTTSAIEVSKNNKLAKVGRTNSEGAKKIKDMAAFFEAKQF